MKTLILPLALGLTSLGAPASAQLYAAIAPESRTSSAPDYNTATYFVSALNSTDQTLQNCRPTLEPTFGDAFPIPVTVTYQTVNAANALEGSPNTAVTLGPGATQGFVIGLEHEPLQGFIGLNFVPVIVCDGMRSQFPFDLGGSWYGSTSPLPDIVAVGQTPSADGVVRIPQAGGLEVFAVAAVNIGAPGSVEVRVAPQFAALFPDVSDATRGTVCETGSNGECLAPPSDVVEVDFATDEVRTFSAFFNTAPDAGLPFQPDTQRVAVSFLAEFGSVVAGKASAAVTAPAPDTGDHPPTGHYALEITQLGDGGTVREQGTTGTFSLLPDNSIFLAGSTWINGFDGAFTRWVIGDPIAPTSVAVINDGPEYSLSARSVLIVNAQDQAFFEADLNMVIDPRRGLVGELVPPQSLSREGVEPLADPLQLRGHYAGFAVQPDAQITDLVGEWSLFRQNYSRFWTGTLTINSDLSFNLEYSFLNPEQGEPDFMCMAAGTLTEFAGANAYYGLELTTTSDDTCAQTWRGQSYAGLLIPNALGGPLTSEALIQLNFLDGEGTALSGARIFMSRSN